MNAEIALLALQAVLLFAGIGSTFSILSGYVYALRNPKDDVVLMFWPCALAWALFYISTQIMSVL